MPWAGHNNRFKMYFSISDCFIHKRSRIVHMLITESLFCWKNWDIIYNAIKTQKQQTFDWIADLSKCQNCCSFNCFSPYKNKLSEKTNFQHSVGRRKDVKHPVRQNKTHQKGNKDNTSFLSREISELTEKHDRWSFLLRDTSAACRASSWPRIWAERGFLQTLNQHASITLDMTGQRSKQ